MFEVFKEVCIYGGLAVFCSSLAVWFFCSETSVLNRAKCHRVNAVANDRATSSSRDEAPVSSSDDCSMGLSESGNDTERVDCIAPLTPAYFTMPPVELSLDDSRLLQMQANSKRKPQVSRSVDVYLLQQLADCQDHTGSQCDKSGYSGGDAGTRGRLCVETPSSHGHSSQQNMNRLISLPRAMSPTETSKKT